MLSKNPYFVIKMQISQKIEKKMYFFHLKYLLIIQYKIDDF